MLNNLNNIVGTLNGYIWGVGMLILIVGSGLYFTIRLHGFQFVHFKDMWSRIIDKQDSDSGISAFGSFCTTMAMRVGTGNVAGVAVAIYMGGGQIVHASSPSTGIKISGNVHYKTILTVRRIF